MAVDLIKDLMRKIGPLLDLDSVDEMNDAPHWRLTIEERYGIDAVLDEERNLLTLIASAQAPDHIDKEELFSIILIHNHGWPTSARARAGMRGDAIVLTEEMVVDGLDLSHLSIGITELIKTLKEFMLNLPKTAERHEAHITQNLIRV